MKCKNCGAEVNASSRRCEYCDSAVAREEQENAAAVANVATSSLDRRADVFEEIKLSAAYAQRKSSARHEKLPGGSGLAMLTPIIFFVVFILISLIITSGALVMAKMVWSDFGAPGIIPAVMSIVPMGFVVLGIVMGVRSFQKYQAYKSAPIRSRAAIITSKRTVVSGGSGDSSATTAYFVTAEYEDGRRHEFAIMEHSLFGRLAEDDVGVLFTRSEFALDFDRVLSL